MKKLQTPKVGEDFICELCGETYQAEVPDFVARAEYEQQFPDLDPDDAEVTALICEPCYREVTAWAKRTGRL